MTSEWRRSKLEVLPEWTQSEIEASSETEVKSKWNQSEIVLNPLLAETSYPTLVGVTGKQNNLAPRRAMVE